MKTNHFPFNTDTYKHHHRTFVRLTAPLLIASLALTSCKSGGEQKQTDLEAAKTLEEQEVNLPNPLDHGPPRLG